MQGLKIKSRYLFWMISLAVLSSTVFAQTSSDGTLSVSTDPIGVKVWVDDRYIGDTPIRNLKLEPGRYTVRLVDETRKLSINEEVYVESNNQTVLNKKLSARGALLSVETNPPGAEVAITVPLGKSPINQSRIIPGNYQLEIRHPNADRFEPSIQNLILSEGQSAAIQDTLIRINPFDMKALIRVGLGAAVVGTGIWAIVEESQNDVLTRNLAFILSSTSLIALEVVAFF